MRSEFNTLKSQTKRIGDHKKNHSQRNRKDKSSGQSNPKSNNRSRTKHDFSWKTVVRKEGELKTMTKYDKSYNWCSVKSVVPSIVGSTRWIMHKTKDYKCYAKKVAKRGWPKSNIIKRRARVLQVKSKMVALKRMQIKSNTEEEYPSCSSEESDAINAVDADSNSNSKFKWSSKLVNYAIIFILICMISSTLINLNCKHKLKSKLVQLRHTFTTL